jgi:hypothetical protein
VRREYRKPGVPGWVCCAEIRGDETDTIYVGRIMHRPVEEVMMIAVGIPNSVVLQTRGITAHTYARWRDEHDGVDCNIML